MSEWSNWRELGVVNESLTFTDCQSGDFYIELGFSRSAIGIWTEGIYRNTSSEFVHQYEAVDSSSQEQWTVTSDRFKESGADGDELNSGFIHYRNPVWQIEINTTQHTVVDAQHSVVGSFTRVNFTTGAVEIVDIDISRYIDDAGVTQITGFIHAMQTGELEQSFSVELLPDSPQLVRYTVTRNSEVRSITEPY